MAIIEAKIIVAKLIKRFSLTLKEGYELKMTNKFMAEPEDPVEINIEKR